MYIYTYESLNQKLPGQVYRREMLLPLSKALDRDFDTLVEKGLLRRLAVGLYTSQPNQSSVCCLLKIILWLLVFLRDKHFLLIPNSLGVGLTQLYNPVLLY